eukprot:SAG31_NODE_2244_length_6101_cov_2.601133_1_plen_81_part_00
MFKQYLINQTYYYYYYREKHDSDGYHARTSCLVAAGGTVRRRARRAGSIELNREFEDKLKSLRATDGRPNSVSPLLRGGW